MDKQVLLCEYNKHIQNAPFPIMPLGVAYFVLLVIVSQITVSLVFPVYRNIDSLSCEYSHIVESDLLIDQYTSESLISSLVTINNDDKQMNVNVYMINLNKSFTLGGESIILDESDIVISSLVSERLNANVGDAIYLGFPTSLESKRYTVVGICSYSWNYFDISNNSDFSVVHIGYSEEIKENNKSREIYFLNESQYQEFAESEYAYIRHHDIKNEESNLKSLIIIAVIVSFVLEVIISFVSLYYMHKIIGREIIKYYKKGCQRELYILIYRVDHVLFCILPIISALICVCLRTMDLNLFFYCAGPLVIVFIMGITVMFKGERYYERTC